jgi:hypothetical protein
MYILASRELQQCSQCLAKKFTLKKREYRIRKDFLKGLVKKRESRDLDGCISEWSCPPLPPAVFFFFFFFEEKKTAGNSTPQTALTTNHDSDEIYLYIQPLLSFLWAHDCFHNDFRLFCTRCSFFVTLSFSLSFQPFKSS